MTRKRGRELLLVYTWLLMAVLEGLEGTSSWTIRLYTSDYRNAGTGDDINIKIYWPGGQTYRKVWLKSLSTLDRGQMDEANFQINAAGTPTKIEAWIEGRDDGWGAEKMELKRSGSNQWLVYPMHEWLSLGKRYTFNSVQFRCVDYKFGEHCEESCRCKDETEICDKKAGWCRSGCKAGWTGGGCQEPVCGKRHRLCSNSRQCVHERAVCDGRRDCPDASDETGCEKPQCPPHWELCKNELQCMFLGWKCDGIRNCGDGSDEPGDDECKRHKCYTGYMKCADQKRCLPEHKFCDGRVDCVDGSDERKAEAQQQLPLQSSSHTARPALLSVVPLVVFIWLIRHA